MSTRERVQKMDGPNKSYIVKPATSTEELSAIAELFKDYTTWLDLDLTFQDYATELASLPGKYAPPAGALFIALNNDGVPLGCVALRPMAEPSICEMKRLYISPEGRGLGLGKRLVIKVLNEAKQIGYRKMRLDTLPRMQSAVTLYEKLGFVKIDPYYETPLEGTLFLELDLAEWKE